MSLVIPMAVKRKIEQLSQAKDPKRAIIDAVGNLDGMRVFSDLVLIGIYYRPEKTSGGIIRPQENVEEDGFQGKVGLVLKTGPIAHGDWEAPEEMGHAAKVGSWIVFHIKDGWPLIINNTPCRLLPYERVRLSVADPTMID